jgi:hypothetical protein
VCDNATGDNSRDKNICHKLHNLYEFIFQHVSRKIRFPKALQIELIPDTNVVLVYTNISPEIKAFCIIFVGYD